MIDSAGRCLIISFAVVSAPITYTLAFATTVCSVNLEGKRLVVVREKPSKTEKMVGKLTAGSAVMISHVKKPAGHVDLRRKTKPWRFFKSQRMGERSFNLRGKMLLSSG